ncbi:MAG: sugar ABC transporter substrate-binding protein [Bacteroidetes bacterium]|nr:sugar ABC transporter substrate-binding protein [Bacteroidota bacterium]
MIRRLFIVSLSIVLLQLGCRTADDRKTIEFWTLQLSPAFNEYFTELIARYEQAHPDVRIRWVDVPYDAAVQKLLASAVAGDPPDVVNLSADFLSKFHAMKALADLRPAVQTCGYTFLPNALDLCRFDSALVAVPWYLNTYVALYNKELLRTAGMTERDVPRTFDGLISFIRTYRQRTGKHAFFWNIGKESYLPMMLGAEGIPMTDERMTRARFNEPAAVAAIDRWVQLYREGFLPAESIIKPGSAIVEAYQSGQVPLIFTGPVFLQRIRSNAPAIYERTGVAPAIVGAAGRHELAAMAISVLTTSPHPAEAADFALFVTDPANQLAFSRQTATFPSVMEALQDSFFLQGNGSVIDAGRAVGAADLANAGRLRKYLLHPEFDRLRDAFDEAVQNACLGKVSTADALNKAAQEWDRILEGS